MSCRVRNEEVLRAGIERGLASRADQRILRWVGHVERIDEYLMARKLLAEVSGGRVRGKPYPTSTVFLGQQRNDDGGS